MLFRFSIFFVISVNLIIFVNTVYVSIPKKLYHIYKQDDDVRTLRIKLKKIYFINSKNVKGWSRRKNRLKVNKQNKETNEFQDNFPNDERTCREHEKSEDDTDFTCFDDYFNAESPKNYAKLEAEKLKIIKESVQSNKEEIKKMMEKSYKDDYMKLMKEEKEDAELSTKVYESIKITFHMNENINNVLFTQYSNMISKLKEQSVILKNIRTLYEKKKTEGEDSYMDSSNKQTDETKEENSEKNVSDDSPQMELPVEPTKKNLFENLGKKSSKDRVDEIIKDVHFFKPENYQNLTSTKTFSDKLFTNVKIETRNVIDFYEDKIDVSSEKEGEKEKEEETGKTLLMQNSVSLLQQLKENVKSSLKYKTENIIKDNLDGDHLHGRVKVHWFPKFMKRTIEKLPEFIKMSDIIIEVRNSVIPFVFDDLYSLNFFNFVTNKPKIIVYTRCDVSSEKGNEEWGHYYRRILFWADKRFNRNIDKENENQMKKSAVIFVDAKNGGKEIIVLKKLINKLCQHVVEKKKKKGISNYKIKCIFLGLPNVGKSALINRLLNLKKTKSYDSPGVTKVIQMYSSKKYELIDTPGLLADNLYKIQEKEYNKNNRILETIYNFNANDYSQNNIVHIKNYADYMHIENNIYLLALCNHISPQCYDIYNIAEVLIQNMYNVYLYNNDYIDLKKIIKRYEINFTECLNNDGMFSAFHFIQKLAKNKFQNDLNKASMRLVSDFRKNYLGKITLNYPLYFNKKKITLKVSRKFVKQKSDKYLGW